jgi:RNA polymerase sigma factor (sigma-70 family)
MARKNMKREEINEKLTEQLLGLVKIVIQQFLKMRQDSEMFEDIFQAGCLGIMKAIDKYDPDRDDSAQLSTYATFWIKSFIVREMKRLMSPLRYPEKQSVRELMPNYTRYYNQVTHENPHASDSEVCFHIAELAECDIETVHYVQEIRRPLQSLDAPMQTDQHGSDLTLASFIPCSNRNPEEEAISNELSDTRIDWILNSSLNHKERYVIRRRYLDSHWTLQEIGQELGVSRERVRQLEKLALEKMQKVLEHRPFEKAS